MLECPLYRDLRVKYIRKYYWNRTNMHKLFKSENSIVVHMYKKVWKKGIMFCIHDSKL